MRILIAEDDPSFRRLLEEKLAMWGYDVVVADNGDAALQILQSEDPPRLAMLDWMMPGMDGVDVCREVRGKTNNSYTYIILLTSQQRDEDLVAGMEAGADDYITSHSSTMSCGCACGRDGASSSCRMSCLRPVTPFG